MAKFQDPFPIYKDGQTKTVHGVDYPGWAKQGWSLEPQAQVVPLVAAIDPEIDQHQPSAYVTRKKQLDDLYADGWQHIERIAKELDIDKPEDGWKFAIPLILEAEGLKP